MLRPAQHPYHYPDTLPKHVIYYKTTGFFHSASYLRHFDIRMHASSPVSPSARATHETYETNSIPSLSCVTKGWPGIDQRSQELPFLHYSRDLHSYYQQQPPQLLLYPDPRHPSYNYPHTAYNTQVETAILPYDEHANGWQSYEEPQAFDEYTSRKPKRQKTSHQGVATTYAEEWEDNGEATETEGDEAEERYESDGVMTSSKQLGRTESMKMCDKMARLTITQPITRTTTVSLIGERLSDMQLEG